MGAIIPNPVELYGKGDLADALSGHFVKDPLSEITRKERRTLLAVSALGAIMVKANIVPQKISALGIDFGEINRTVLLRSLALVVGYFLIAFILYAISDFVAWRVSIQNYLFELSAKDELEAVSKHGVPHEPVKNRAEEDALRRKALYEYRLRRLGCWAKPVAFFRAAFDYLFPVVLAVYAIVLLF
jgi:hypothetical protein